MGNILGPKRKPQPQGSGEHLSMPLPPPSFPIASPLQLTLSRTLKTLPPHVPSTPPTESIKHQNLIDLKRLGAKGEKITSPDKEPTSGNRKKNNSLTESPVPELAIQNTILPLLVLFSPTASSVRSRPGPP